MLARTSLIGVGLASAAFITWGLWRMFGDYRMYVKAVRKLFKHKGD